MYDKLKFIEFSQTTKTSYKIVILAKEEDLNKDKLIEHYIQPILDITPHLTISDFIAIGLDFGGSKTPKVNATIKPWLNFLASIISCDLLLCTNTNYFKILSSINNTAHMFGSTVDCTFKGYEKIKIAIAPSYGSVYYDDKNKLKIELANKACSALMLGVSFFTDIIKTAMYPQLTHEKTDFLDSLHQYPMLSCDIETFSLSHTKALIASISFAWSKYEGGAFIVDKKVGTIKDFKMGSKFVKGETTRKNLSDFFYKFLIIDKKRIIWHNISFDAKILIWELIMESKLSNKEEMIKGLELFTNINSFEDTKLIAYVATNSCAGNELNLKSLALPFAGNYALDKEEISDVSLLSQEVLLKYNLIDSLSTFYVYDTYYPKMVADNQLSVYETILKPSVGVLMQAELHGMPIDIVKVNYAKNELEVIVKSCIDRISKNPYIVLFIQVMRCNLFHDLHAKWKKKTALLNDSAFSFQFNMNSSTQLCDLLYTMLELPVLDLTKNKNPAAGSKTLKKLKNHTNDPLILELLDITIEFTKATKILTSFIPAFLDAYYDSETDMHYLMGNFNIGGTVSGRLSCNNPNLQQIPSGSTYAKLIKDCFVAPKGKLMVGLDFNSLEDYVSALTTKDPNKLKVYTDGYDGHCLRAYSYFPDRLPDIENTVKSINSIKKKYPDERQDSKAPTFALTYQGTYITLMKNCGFDEEIAKRIENNFLNLYKVSVEYIANKLNEAAKTGYVEVAFGFKVRTPVIHKSLWNSSYTPYEAKAESRTAGNAAGQSYSMLNNRAGIEFQQRVLNSKYRLGIFPIAHIHDAQYFIVDDDMHVLAWMNKHLVECVQWQELPELHHDTVKLGGDLSIFYPSWKTEIVIPNGMYNAEELRTYANQKLKEIQDEENNR